MPTLWPPGLLNGIRATLRRPVPTWAVLVLLAAAAVGGAATVSVTTTTLEGLFGEVATVQTTLTVTAGGIDAVALPASAAGDTSGTAVEMAAVLGSANTALTTGNWKYTATVKESGAATVTSGTYKVELFVDGVSKGGLFMQQGTSDAGLAEGVTFSWDLGSSINSGASAYVVKVTPV